MSRATWYRRGRPMTKPKPALRQPQLAASLGLSLRTFQRLNRLRVLMPPVLALVISGEMKIGQAERLMMETLKEHLSLLQAAAAFTEIGSSGAPE